MLNYLSCNRFPRFMVLSAFLLLIAFSFDPPSVISSEDIPAKSGKPSVPTCSIEDHFFGLGGGAQATWLNTGTGILDQTGTNPITDIFISGRKDEAFLARVEVRAVFGALSIDLLDDEVIVPAGSSRVVNIDLRDAFNIHEKQASYVTNFVAEVSVVFQNGKPGMRQFLEPRYLSVEEDGISWTVFDSNGYLTISPDGITNENERQKVRAIELSRFDSSDGVDLGVGPGVYEIKPLSEATRVRSDDE
jgi:hypothetical protein